MSALVATLALAAGVALLMAANSRRARCRMQGHDWGRPWTDGKRRVERCERCSKVRDHVMVAPTAPVLSQEQIDGTAPVSGEVIAQTLESVAVATAREAERARVAATVRARWSGVDSGRVH